MAVQKQLEELEVVTVKFAGDSGDGIQITGDQFGNTTAIAGNDFSTFPDFPSEIRAPLGTTYGVSSYQIQFAAKDIYTPGDTPDVLVCFNPAALKVNMGTVNKGGIIVVNEDEFIEKNLKKAGFETDPLDPEDTTLQDFRVHKIPITTLTLKALEEMEDMGHQDKLRCKNFLALGVVSWLFQRPLEPIETFLKKKFGRKPLILEANTKVLHAGYNMCDTMEIFPIMYKIPAAKLESGTYRNINGALATSYGLLAAAEKIELPIVYAGYPITPASEVLHTLAALKQFDVAAIQTEDEIAAVTMALGAAYGGSLGITGSSGPGLALKIEALNLAVMTELPLIVFDFMRSGISTGMPTKTEQGDLAMALFGRPSDSHVIVLAPSSASDCFWISIEAVRLATKYMTPVVVLSEGFLINASEPWKIPDIDKIPKMTAPFITKNDNYLPYKRNKETLARDWVRIGTKGLEHTIGGLEKINETGAISQDPENHDLMTRLRAEKVQKVANDIPDIEVLGDKDADLLLVGWGSSLGSMKASAEVVSNGGQKVAMINIRYLNPLPKNLGEILKSYKKVAVVELNLGQLNMIIRSRFLIDTAFLGRVTGQPISVVEMVEFIKAELEALKEH
ncbi:MAG: 2-oxoacid:acceptor oxidoreductase subunit alpha [Thermodesulfobacteriota bacterium]|nr:MAG: 2-oxoacid:acceptor oxidoreductase subunit alpha [Candidatus Dadabacteria bacterium]